MSMSVTNARKSSGNTTIGTGTIIMSGMRRKPARTGAGGRSGACNIGIMIGRVRPSSGSIGAGATNIRIGFCGRVKTRRTAAGYSVPEAAESDSTLDKRLAAVKDRSHAKYAALASRVAGRFLVLGNRLAAG